MVISFMVSPLLSWWSFSFDRTEARISSVMGMVRAAPRADELLTVACSAKRLEAMTSAVAIASIASSAVVAVAVTILSARLARAQQLVQASVTRLDELRGVIDSAALQLRDALYDANGVWSLLDQNDPTNPPPAPVLAEFEKHLNEMDDSKTRIDIRLGPSSDLARRYESTREPLFALWSDFVGVVHQGRDFDASASERLLQRAAQEKDLFLNEGSQLLDPGVTLAVSSRR